MGEEATEGDESGQASGDGAGDATQGQDDDGDDGTIFDLPPLPEPSGCNEGEVGGGGGSFSFIWIANSPEGTVSKIDTETGMELGRYRASAGSNSPSRTSVNQFGDVAVASRGDAGSITKIAARSEDCVESNGLPGIQTSSGPDDVRAFGDDECVLWNTPLPSAGYDRGPRAVAWEGGELDPETCVNTVPSPRVWVSWRGDGNDIEIRRLDGESGTILDSTMVVGGGGRTYGGAVNAEGDFWVATRGGQDNLIHVDAITLDVTVYDVPAGDDYGMTVDANGDPWVVTYNEGTNYVYRLDHATGTFATAANAEPSDAPEKRARQNGKYFMETDWIWGLVGGLMIGAAASFYLLVNGRIMGASGIIGGLVDRTGWSTWAERLAFVAGLALIPALLKPVYNVPVLTHITDNIPAVILAGLLVGIGTRLANGCTSGHGVCGISRLSLRGIAATMFYLISGGLAVIVFRHLLETI